MKFVGIDSSVVIRLLTNAPEDQAKIANEKLTLAHEAKQKVFASDLVITEAYFALQYHYEVPKNEAKKALISMLESGKVDPEPEGQSLIALKASMKDGGAGFQDRLIALQNLKRTHETLTFDKKMAKVNGCLHINNYKGK